MGIFLIWRKEVLKVNDIIHGLCFLVVVGGCMGCEEVT